MRELVENDRLFDVFMVVEVDAGERGEPQGLQGARRRIAGRRRQGGRDGQDLGAPADERWRWTLKVLSGLLSNQERTPLANPDILAALEQARHVVDGLLGRVTIS
jgi:hypothetical protein